jgi:hypothetical protein
MTCPTMADITYEEFKQAASRMIDESVAKAK